VELAPRENPYLAAQGSYGGQKLYSEETAKTIDAEVLKIINESHDEAKRLLNKYRKQLDSLMGALLERETLDDQDILKATGLPPAPPWVTVKLPVKEGGAPKI
jgi:cell division protease FtsH